MKLNGNWEIRKGPMGNDYALIEKREYFSDKYKEYRTRETPRYYPNLETLVKRLVELETLNSIELDNVQSVVAKLEEVRQDILKNIQS